MLQGEQTEDQEDDQNKNAAMAAEVREHGCAGKNGEDGSKSSLCDS